MKIFFRAILALCIALATLAQSHAQVDVTINPVGAIFGSYSVAADFRLADKFSLEASLGITSSNRADYKYFSMPITARGKYYFNPKRGADRFYADAFVRFVNRKTTIPDDIAPFEYSQTRFGAGGGLGYKVVRPGGFVFDIGLGAGRAFVDKITFSDATSNGLTLEWTKVMLVGKLAIGYRIGGRKKEQAG